jgi:hypothetical protein
VFEQLLAVHCFICDLVVHVREAGTWWIRGLLNVEIKNNNNAIWRLES